MEDDDYLHTLRVNLLTMIIALIGLVVELRRRREMQGRRRKRQIWIRTILQARHEEGAYNLLIPKLLTNDDQYRNYFRMSQESFSLLLSMIEPVISKQQTTFRRPLTGSERLAVTLRYLASGLLHYTVRLL